MSVRNKLKKQKQITYDDFFIAVLYIINDLKLQPNFIFASTIPLNIWQFFYVVLINDPVKKFTYFIRLLLFLG